jgi:hypothetical protein
MRFVNTTEKILAKRKANSAKQRVTMIELVGVACDKQALLHLRDERLK